MFKRCPLALSEYHHGALIKVLSNKSRSQRAINSSFLTKAEIIIAKTGIKESDLDYAADGDGSEDKLYEQSITLSDTTHPLLYKLYLNGGGSSRRSLLANVLCRCAEFIENNPEEFALLLTNAFLKKDQPQTEENNNTATFVEALMNEESDSTVQAGDDNSQHKDNLLMTIIDDDDFL
jgi:hypothetical protein